MKITADRRTNSLVLRFADASQLFFSNLGMRLMTAAAGSHAHSFANAMARRLGWDDLVRRKGWPIPQPECSGDWLAVDREKTPALLRAILRHAEILPGQDPYVADAFRVFCEGLSDCFDIPEPAPQDRRLRLVLIGADFWKQDVTQRLERATEIAALLAHDPALVAVWQSPKHEGFKFSVASIFVQKLQAKGPNAVAAQTDEATASAEPEVILDATTSIEAPEVVTQAQDLEPCDTPPDEEFDSPSMGF